jgi:hypothetical protein
VATQIKLDRAPDDRKSFAAGFSTTDLTAQSGKPALPAQIVDVHNAGSSSQNAVVATARYNPDTGARLADEVLTIPLAAGETYPVIGPVTELRSSGANVSAVAYWWADRKTPRNA